MHILTFKNLLTAVASLGLGVFLVWLLLALTPVSLERVLATLGHLNLFYGCLFIVSTFIHLWLTAYRWRLITQKLTGNRQPQRFFLAYVILSNLLSQIVPQQIGTAVVQGMALKLHKVSSFSKGVFSVIYDQIFGVLIPLLLLPVSYLYLVGKISLSVAIFAALSLLLVVHCIILVWHQPIALILIKTYYRVKSIATKNPSKFSEEVPLLAVRFTVRLFWLSALRHLNWIFRSFFVVMAGGFAIKFWAIAFTTNLVQSAMLVSITPANLGIMEWGWIGGLGLLGIPAATAGSFALSQRIMSLFAFALIALCFWLLSFRQFRSTAK